MVASTAVAVVGKPKTTLDVEVCKLSWISWS
jgi:hypothetical protein